MDYLRNKSFKNNEKSKVFEINQNAHTLLKIKISVLFVFLFVFLAIQIKPNFLLANDFEARLQKFKHQQRVLNEKLKSFGIDPSSHKKEKDGNFNENKNVNQLFKTHTDFKTLAIYPGKLLFGKTYTRLIVGSEGSPALIVLDDDQGMFSNLRLLGVAKASSTQGRLILEFNRLILKTGKTIAINATSLDSSGAYGLAAQIFSGKALALAGSMATGFISGMALGSQSQNQNAFGFSQVDSSTRNAILQGLAQSTSDQSKRLIEEATQEKPVLVVEEETPLSVLFQDEVRL